MMGLNLSKNGIMLGADFYNEPKPIHTSEFEYKNYNVVKTLIVKPKWKSIWRIGRMTCKTITNGMYLLEKLLKVK